MATRANKGGNADCDSRLRGKHTRARMKRQQRTKPTEPQGRSEQRAEQARRAEATQQDRQSGATSEHETKAGKQTQECTHPNTRMRARSNRIHRNSRRPKTSGEAQNRTKQGRETSTHTQKLKIASSVNADSKSEKRLTRTSLSCRQAGRTAHRDTLSGSHNFPAACGVPQQNQQFPKSHDH